MAPTPDAVAGLQPKLAGCKPDRVHVCPELVGEPICELSSTMDSVVLSWVSAIVAPAVVAAVVSVAASGVAGIMRRRAEHRAWLRDVRHDKYAALITAGRHLGAVMRFTGPYDEYPEELAQAYDKWFEAAVAAQLLASRPLQESIQKARFAAARYQETRKPYAQFHAWMNDVEVDARAELGLPGYAGWDRFSTMGNEVVQRVDREPSVAPDPLVPHWRRRSPQERPTPPAGPGDVEEEVRQHYAD
jgi:uncharacterized protein YciI